MLKYVSLLIIAVATMCQAQELDATLTGSRWSNLSIKYPSSVLQIAHDAPQGDPNVHSVMDPDVLRSTDKSLELFLSGSYNALNLPDAKSYIDQMLDWYKGTKVTYRVSKDHWAVASGTRGNKIFYYKVIARCENGAEHCDQPESFAIAAFTYSATKRAAYNKIVAAMSQTLTAAVPAN